MSFEITIAICHEKGDPKELIEKFQYGKFPVILKNPKIDVENVIIFEKVSIETFEKVKKYSGVDRDYGRIIIADIDLKTFQEIMKNIYYKLHPPNNIYLKIKIFEGYLSNQYKLKSALFVFGVFSIKKKIPIKGLIFQIKNEIEKEIKSSFYEKIILSLIPDIITFGIILNENILIEWNNKFAKESIISIKEFLESEPKIEEKKNEDVVKKFEENKQKLISQGLNNSSSLNNKKNEEENNQNSFSNKETKLENNNQKNTQNYGNNNSNSNKETKLEYNYQNYLNNNNSNLFSKHEIKSEYYSENNEIKKYKNLKKKYENNNLNQNELYDNFENDNELDFNNKKFEHYYKKVVNLEIKMNYKNININNQIKNLEETMNNKINSLENKINLLIEHLSNLNKFK